MDKLSNTGLSPALVSAAGDAAELLLQQAVTEIELTGFPGFFVSQKDPVGNNVLARFAYNDNEFVLFEKDQFVK